MKAVFAITREATRTLFSPEMTIPPSPTPQRRKWALGWFALTAFLLILAGTGFAYFGRFEQGAERVIDDLPLYGNVRALVKDGVAYYSQRSQGETGGMMMVSSAPSTVRFVGARLTPFGAWERQVTEIPDLPGGLSAVSDQLDVEKGFILWIDQEINTSLLGQPFTPQKMPPGTPLGYFAAPVTPASPEPGERRRTQQREENGGRGVNYLWRIPVNGGKPERAKLNTNGVLSVFLPPSAEHLYWLEDPKSQETLVETKKGYRYEVPRTASLMRVSLQGGAPETIAAHLPASQLMVNEQGVGYLSWEPYPDRLRTLHFLPFPIKADAPEIILPHYRSETAPFEYQGRWHWIEPESDEFPNPSSFLANEP